MRLFCLFVLNLLVFHLSAKSFVKEVYWYNNTCGDELKEISIKGNTISTGTCIEFVCDESIEMDSFTFDAYENNKHILTKKITDLQREAAAIVVHSGLKSFYVELEVNAFPDVIHILNNIGNIVATFNCSYVNLKGLIKNDFPHSYKAVLIGPNNYEDLGILAVLDKSESYSIKIPQRKYSCIAFFCDTYGTQTLENWIYDLSLKNVSEYALNVEIGNLELYDLKVNNEKALSFSFRPMNLQEPVNKKIKIGDKEYSEIDFQLLLSPKDISIYRDGKMMKHKSLSSFYEIIDNIAIKSYIIHTKKKKNLKNHLYTVKVRYGELYGSSSVFLK